MFSKCCGSLKRLYKTQTIVNNDPSKKNNDCDTQSQSNRYWTEHCYSNEYGEVIELHLHNNSMSFLSIDVFVFLKNLNKLWLSDNSLSSLPKEIDNLKCLTSIWLSSNLFEKIPTLPENIKHLYLDNNLLTDLSGIEYCLMLETLHVHCCRITSISDVIGSCTQLVCLEAQENHITSISPLIGKLKKLVKLHLHSNNIQHIPDEIGYLTNLSWISLHYNKLTSIPYSFVNLTSLLRLSLHNNQLTDIHGLNIKSLQVVSLFHNNITELPEEVLKNLFNCRKFAIQQNLLIILPHTIKCMTSLETLWLYGNNFEVLPDELNELPKLQCVWLLDEEVSKYPNIKSTLINTFNELK